MIVIVGVLLGILYGGWTARRRGGKGADIAQWAVVHAMLFGVIGLFLTLILDRMLLG